MKKFLLFMAAVVLPAAAWIVGLLMLGDSFPFGEIMPTWKHVVLVGSVPAINLTVWMCLRHGLALERKSLRAMLGFSLGVCIVYAIDLLPAAALGLGFCGVAFWYFGVGFLGLLPGAPLYAVFAIFRMKKHLAAATQEKGLPPVGGFGLGLLVSAFVWFLIFVDAALVPIGRHQALSDDPGKSARGIRMMRASTRADLVAQSCREWGRFASFPNAHALVWSKVGKDTDATQEKLDVIYYRVTGEDPQYLRNFQTRRRALSWDSMVGGEKVGGIVEGLSLKGSAYDTTVDEVAGVGYSEWTMTFANAREWADAEARARIALPHGGVVSRLTLWINGEECEAAFGKKGQVRRAYESVVRRNQDPVLVNVCGPDQVQLQCFPVPRKGEMKVRLGVTFPLEVAADGKSARLPAPAIVSRNFNLPKGLLGLPSAENFAFKQPPAAVSVYRDESLEALKGSAIVQRSSVAVGWCPKRVAVVLDTSKGMEASLASVRAALGEIPESVKAEFWIVGDEAPEKPVSALPSDLPCVGGKLSLTTLVRAAESLANGGEESALVWISAGQPVTEQADDVLALKLRKAGNVRFYPCQIGTERASFVESLPTSERVVSLSADAVASGADSALRRAFADWTTPRWIPVRTKVASGEVPAEAVAAGGHLGRLWAAEETARTYLPGDPVRLEKAQELALPWHIVTPVTGAVVLETAAQYKANGLEPVDAASVPTTPEPSSWLCFLVAALVVACLVLMRRFRFRASAAA